MVAKIQVLDKHTAELIAAGEVVERPSSVVKELVENAIDAGATSVTVEIQNGGVSFLSVSDNGSGFPREDVPTAFLRHATSKIRQESDLERIGTLGFRGEALASIAAVSRVELTTRTEDDLAGVCYRLEGGEEVSLSDVGCPRGSTICVRDLFYNVPARMKFLKKDVGEANAVAGVMDRLALSHPEISFRLIREGREELLTPGDNDLYSCIGAVLGREFAKGLIPVEYTLEGIHVYGYSCRPDAARANRTMQHFFVNGRYVKTRTAMAALEQAYKGAIMVGKFPSCVLNIDMPPEAVDANVHPAKIEVRFINEKPIFDAVYHGIKTALEGDDRPKQAVLFTPVREPEAPAGPRRATVTAQQIAQRVEATPIAEPPSEAAVPPVAKRPSAPPSAGPRQQSSYAVLHDKTALPPGFLDGMPPRRVAETLPLPETKSWSETKTLLTLTDDPEPVRLVGEVLHTYIVAEWRGSVYFIDKHAAHERLLYNELQKAEHRDSQLLLAPLTVALNREEADALLSAQEMLTEAGFGIEEFGNGSLLVRAVPMMLADGNVAESLREIAGGLLNGRREVTTSRQEWIYHSVACRAAVKAGDASTPQELQRLAERVLYCDDVRTCPHGRPVCFELTAHEIEKQFGRIL